MNKMNENKHTENKLKKFNIIVEEWRASQNKEA